MRYGLVLGAAVASLWAVSALAQDCCAGSKVGDGGRYKDQSGSPPVAKAWTRVSLPAASIDMSDTSGSKSR
jgi:hypothetical protein